MATTQSTSVRTDALAQCARVFSARYAFWAVLAAALILLPCLRFQPALAEAAGNFEEVDCAAEFDLFGNVAGLVCGYLTVPSNHDIPDGKLIRLGVVIFEAENALPDPVFLAQGGPGGSTIDAFSVYLLGPQASMRTDRDFVLLEQRGTRHSEPALYCDEYDELAMEYLDEDLPQEEFTKKYLAALRQCRQRLDAAGITLSDFDSYQNARDIEALRLALGYGKINLYGVSYGSLLAQHYMRLFPDSLRSVILDAVVAPQQNFLLDVAYHENRVFQHLFDSCAADPVCERDYPDLENVFYALIEKLNADPVHLSLRDPETSQRYTALLDGDGFNSVMYQTLYVADFVRTAPYLIYAVEGGDYTAFSTILSLLTFDRSMSYGMYYSVMCAEDADFTPDDMILSDIHPYIAGFHRNDAAEFLEICEDWDVEPLGRAVDEAVQHDLPVLLLSGGFDPITPSEYAEIAAASLTNSYQVEFPRGAHGQLFDGGCADSIVQAFWQNPGQAPDTACVAEQSTPAFISRDGLLPLPLLSRLLGLDPLLLPEAVLFALAWLGGFSSVFILPVAWAVQFFKRRKADTTARPALLLRFAGLAALLHSLTVLVFGGLMIKILLDRLYDNLLVFGFHASVWPVFLLPWIALLLTLAMLVIVLAGWRSPAWSIWRKGYYTFVFLSGLACVGTLVYWRLFLPWLT
ncbi:MAG: alpha/beta fold hydrolase [Chloroflexota bacterium]